MSETDKKVPRRIAQTVLNSLKGGVVPRIGLPYITVGRKSEIQALLHDVDIISEGGASFRFIVGKYGSGKSFLLQTIRNYVMDRGFIVADADLSPERRPQGTHGPGPAPSPAPGPPARTSPSPTAAPAVSRASRRSKSLPAISSCGLRWPTASATQTS